MPPAQRIQELLFDAARLGRTDVLPALVQAGGDISAIDVKGYTPLILASYNGSEAATALLLARGAAVDQADTGRGNTPLMGVAFKGYANIAQMLLEAGANPEQTNRAGQTALMMAAMFGHGEIVERLLARGADPARVDAAGNSALSVAIAQNNSAMAEQLTKQPR